MRHYTAEKEYDMYHKVCINQKVDQRKVPFSNKFFLSKMIDWCAPFPCMDSMATKCPSKSPTKLGLVLCYIILLGRCPCVATVYKIFNKILVHKKEHRIFQLQQKRYIPHLQGQGRIFFLLYTSANNKNQRTIQVHRHTCTLQEQPSDGSLLTVARIAHLVSSSYTSWAVMF
jgi:hypothetical protein